MIFGVRLLQFQNKGKRVCEMRACANKRLVFLASFRLLTNLQASIHHLSKQSVKSASCKHGVSTEESFVFSAL